MTRVTRYPCGCRARNGLIVSRCALASTLRTRLQDLEATGRLEPVPNISFVDDEARVTDGEQQWADGAEARWLRGQLLQHYPSWVTR